MAGFGSLNAAAFDPEAVTQPEETWQDREAQAALQLIEADKAKKAAAGRSWYDTINDVAHFPHRMLGQLTTTLPPSPAQPGPSIDPGAFGTLSPGEEAAMMPETFVNPLVKNAADAVGAAIKSGVTAPHDAMTGKLPMVGPDGHITPDAVGRGFDLASIAGGGSVAGTAERAARSAGADLRVLGRKIGGEAPVAPPVSEMAAPYHAALEGGTTLASDSAKPGAAIAAAEHAPPFTTAAEPALERIGRKTGTPEQWKNDLAKYGVTKEEMQHRGLGDLKPGQPMSKEQVAAHLENNPVEIKPVEYASMPKDWNALTPEQQYKVGDRYEDVTGGSMNSHNLPDWYEEIAQHSHGGHESALDSIFNPPRYASYQLPGGENYRERLLTLPDPSAQRSGVSIKAVVDKLRAKYGDNFADHWTDAEKNEYVYGSSKGKPPEPYRSGHWEEPNVIVHRRSTDREMPVPFTPEEQAAADAHAAAKAKLEDLRAQQGAVGKQITETAKPLEQARADRAYEQLKAGKISRAQYNQSLESYIDHPSIKPLQDKLQALRAEEDALNKSLPPEPKQRTIKTLHDEEDQSDWHQAGAKVGYQPDRKKLLDEVIQKEKASIVAHQLNKPDKAEYLAAYQEADARLRAFEKNGKPVPDGPFKDSWQRLSLHDQIREAAEKGYDRISWTSGKASPTNPKNLGQTGEEAEKVERGLIKHYDERRVNLANKIGKAHGVQVEKGSIGGDYDAAYAKYIRDGHHPRDADRMADKKASEGKDIYHMDVPQSLKDQALKKGFSMFEDSGKAGGAIAAAEHAKPYHDLLDKAPTAEHGFGPLDSHPREQALTVNDILHPDTPAMKPNSRTVEDIAKGLHDRGSAALEKMGVEGGRIEGSAPHTDELLSRGIASEIKAALGRGNTASDWYTHKIAEAMDIASEMHPELKNDPHQKMGFTTALAVTSQGEAVTSNVRLANQAYEHFKKTGKFPTNVDAKNGPAMNANFVKMNGLLERLGPEGTRDFLHREFTVKDLEQAGYDVGGENKQTKVYGSAILGPKIGQGFYQNLNGNYKPVTMDLWFMRAWGRMTGTLVGKTDVTKPTARLQDALREEGIRVPRDPAKLAKLADEAVLAHGRDFRANRKLYDSGKRSKSELTYAAERFQKNTTGINEQPTSGSQRAWMRSVVDRARGILEENGHKVTNADLQAIWWYPEKELYAKLGGRDSDKINIDYATAFRDLKNKGATNGEETGAVRPLERRPGSPAKANDAGTGGQGGRGSKKADGPKVKFGSLAAGAD